MDIDGRAVRLNCPHCGKSMRFVDANSPLRPALKTDAPAEPTFFVFECPEHGLQHFGPQTPLTAGPPPPRGD
jgi:hypothetical protein